MVVHEYENAKAYLEIHEEALLEYESCSQLVLFSAYQNVDRFDHEECRFGVVFDQGQTILHFCNVLPHHMDLYVPCNLEDHIEEAAKALADYAVEEEFVIKGLFGKQNVCQSFIEQYKKGRHCGFVEKRPMDIMEIRELYDITLVEGNHRLATEEDMKLIAEWIVNIQIEAEASEINYELALIKAKKLIEAKRFFLYEDNEGTVVSMAAASKQLLHGVAFNYVYTPEEYRGIGYAVANVYHMTKNYLEQGYQFCTLYVDKEHNLSSRAYEKLGYQFVYEIYEYQTIIP